MEREWDGANNAYDRYYSGFIYDLTIWNVAKDFAADIQSTITLCDCDSGGITDDACIANSCISTCAFGNFQDGAVCTACDPTCNGNCVRSGDGVYCNLCDNMICTECDTFTSPGNCSTCATNAEQNVA
jgi:hypothetical protein